MRHSKLGFYDRISALHRPKSYEGKIMLVAFIGTHLPLIALLAYAINSLLTTAQKFRVLLVALIATLVGAASTLYAVHRLLEPIKQVSRSLREYIEANKKPELPINYPDEAGRLMADTQLAIERLDKVIGSLEEVSSRDHLTDLYNRRAGEQRLDADVTQARRSGAPFCLALLDIDNFKQINDQHGHAFGDAALRQVAGIIDDNIRAGDWAARWGGDEFLIGLSNLKQAAASVAVERLASAIESSPLPVPGGGDVVISASAGVAQYNGEDESQLFFEKADHALLGIKRGKGVELGA